MIAESGRDGDLNTADRSEFENWRARALFFRCRRFALKSGRDYGLQEGHHGAKFRTELLDRVLLLALARGEKIGAAFFILCDPGLCESAVANLREDLTHLFARLFGDDARSGGIRSEEHTSELQSPYDLVCRLLLEKKKRK